LWPSQIRAVRETRKRKSESESESERGRDIEVEQSEGDCARRRATITN
jgi:hypothetical protein